MPLTVIPMEAAVRTIERIAAFIPGESPPLVSTPIVFITFHLTKKEQSYSKRNYAQTMHKTRFRLDFENKKCRGQISLPWRKTE